MDEKTKRELREEKRIVKRLGNKRVRRLVRETLAADPDMMLDFEPSYGRYCSETLNGIDRQPSH